MIKHVITLVHGTFATGAPWTQPTSAMSVYLKTHLNDAVTERFDWSGSNSPSARKADAVELAEQLKRPIDTYKDATHVIVCHSHGGEVSLRAATDLRVRDCIAGIVCLATPFVVARKRDLGEDPVWFASSAVVAMLAIIVWMIRMPDTWPAWLALAVSGAVGALLCGAVLALFMKWRKWANQFERLLALPEINPARLLIVRAPADEASALLAAGQLFSQVSVLMILWMRRVFDWVKHKAEEWAQHKGRLAGIAAAAFVLALVMLVPYAELRSLHYSSWITRLPLVAFGAFFVVSMMSLVLLVPGLGVNGATVPLQIVGGVIVWPVVALMSMALVLPFGYEIALANILLDVAGEPTPQTSTDAPWQVYLAQPSTSADPGGGESNLMHSRIYNNPHVHALIVRWIRQLAPVKLGTGE